MIVLDGAMGTEIERRGLDLPAPGWSAVAIRARPGLVAEIHADYAAAGATAHTACTFRCQPRVLGDAFRAYAKEAVALARAAVPRGQAILGSVGPLEDCYRPDLAPAPETCLREHALAARALADAGADRLFCETFASVDEAACATRACRETGLEVWVSLTPGYDGSLLAPAAVAEGARRLADLGAAIVLVSCTRLDLVPPYAEALARSGIPFGVYANVYGEEPEEAAPRYVEAALAWAALGARVIGGCCGTDPGIVGAVANALREDHSADSQS